MNLRLLIFLAIAGAGFPLLAADVDVTLQAAKRAAEIASPAPPIPRDAFLVKATVRDIVMSPDGRWLSYRRDSGQRLELWLRRIADGMDHRVLPDSEGTDVRWSGDGARLWLPDAHGLGVYDLASMTGRRVFRFDEARRQAFWMVDSKAVDSAVLREKVAANGEWLYRYLAVDANGEVRTIHESRQALKDVLLDSTGKVRYAAGNDGVAFDTVLWRFNEDETQELMRCPLPQQCMPVAFDGDSVWALAHNGEDLMSLQRLDAKSSDWQTLHSDPRGIADAVSLLMQPDGRDWFAMAYRPDRVEWHGHTEIARTTLSELQARLPGANLDLAASNDGTRWLVRARRADWPYDRHFLFDVAARTLSSLFEEGRRSALATELLAEAIPVHWRGKDGMALHGFAYLPKGLPLETTPVIAVIHGGPFNQSLGEADPGTQLLVNRGYIVFEPNFRASTGYGVNYVTATRGDFGKHGVLDDILTGLDHLIANGIGDARQQAVAGHSFGGYASLLAITHHPDRFVFAVPSAAPVDMAWTMADIAVEGGSALSADGPPMEVLFPGYGVPFGERDWHDRMHRESPLAHAATRHTPVYLWAGAKDDRVTVESLVRYFAESNVDFKPTLLIDPDAGHSPRERLNLEALVWLMEAAADLHFGGGVTPPSPELKTFLEKNLRVGETDLLD